MSQGEVYFNARRRGYLGGYTPGQIILRNIVKLIEEIGNVCELVELPWSFQERVKALADEACEQRATG